MRAFILMAAGALIYGYMDVQVPVKETEPDCVQLAVHDRDGNPMPYTHTRCD